MSEQHHTPQESWRLVAQALRTAHVTRRGGWTITPLTETLARSDGTHYVHRTVYIANSRVTIALQTDIVQNDEIQHAWASIAAAPSPLQQSVAAVEVWSEREFYQAHFPHVRIAPRWYINGIMCSRKNSTEAGKKRCDERNNRSTRLPGASRRYSLKRIKRTNSSSNSAVDGHQHRVLDLCQVRTQDRGLQEVVNVGSSEASQCQALTVGAILETAWHDLS